MEFIDQIHRMAPKKTEDRQVKEKVEPLQSAQAPIRNNAGQVGERFQVADRVPRFRRIGLDKHDRGHCSDDRQQYHDGPETVSRS